MVIPAVTNSTQTTLTVIADAKVATVNVQETHLIFARDMYGNAQINNNDVFFVTITYNQDPKIIVSG